MSSSLHTQLCSCVRRFVLEALCMWGWTCVCGVLFTYVGFDLSTWHTWQRLYSAHFHFFFNYFTSICNLKTSFCHFCIWTSLHPSFYHFSFIKNIISHHFCLNQESNVIFFFCSLYPLMLVGEVLTRWWSGTTSLFSRLGLISRKRALSLSLAFLQKGPQVLPWCNVSLRGGGILLTPFILQSER